MKNTCLLVHYISSFESTSYKRIQDAVSLPVPLYNILFFYIASELTVHQQITFLHFYRT